MKFRQVKAQVIERFSTLDTGYTLLAYNWDAALY